MSTCSACLRGTTPPPAAWISQRCSTLWPSPGTTRLTVTTAGLIPQTSHILVAIFFCLLLRVSVRRGGGRAPGPLNGPIGRVVTYSRVGAPLYPAHLVTYVTL